MTSPKDTFPPQARRVFKGVIYEVWQWEQKMYDGSKAVFEGLKRPDTVEAIATVGDKILLQEQEQPDRATAFLSLPGGQVNDETAEPLEEIKRELLEETGYVSDDWELWKTITPHHRIAYTIYYFIARDCRPFQEPQLDAGERIKTKFIGFDELLLLSENPIFRGQELKQLLFEMRLNPKRSKEFYKLLFDEDK